MLCARLQRKRKFEIENVTERENIDNPIIETLQILSDTETESDLYITIKVFNIVIRKKRPILGSDDGAPVDEDMKQPRCATLWYVG